MRGMRRQIARKRDKSRLKGRERVRVVVGERI